MLRTLEGEEEAEGKEEEEEEYVETNNPTNKTGEGKDDLREEEVWQTQTTILNATTVGSVGMLPRIVIQ